jgi:hypothetical protein
MGRLLLCRTLKSKTKASTVMANMVKHTIAELRFALGNFVSSQLGSSGNPVRLGWAMSRSRQSARGEFT